MKEWEEILRFNDKYFPNWRNTSVIYYSNALAGEIGEICNLVKKAIGGGTNRRTVDSEEIAIEGIDVFIYLVLLFETLGISRERFQEIFNFKMRIIIRRMETSK